MATEKFSNNAESTLASTITSGATSLAVATGAGALFPSTGNFRIVIDAEIIIVGARTGDTLSSLTRGAEGTTAAGHLIGASVKHGVTAGGLLQAAADAGISVAGITTGEVPVWNGTAFARSSVTPMLASGISGYPTDRGKALRGDGTWQDSPGVYARFATGVDTASTNTEQTLVSQLITGGHMGTNRLLRLTQIGDFLYNNNTADTLRLRVKFGGTTFFDDVTSGQLGAGRLPWMLTVLIANLGANNSQMITVMLHSVLTGTGAPTAGIGDIQMLAGAIAARDIPTGGMGGISTLGTIATASDQTLAVTATWSASSANNSLRQRYAVLELV